MQLFSKTFTAETSLLLFSGCLLFLVVFTVTGCGTTDSTKASYFTTEDGGAPDFRKYEHLTIVPLRHEGDKITDAKAGRRIAAGIAIRVKEDFPLLFKSVSVKSTSQNLERELIVTGAVTEYDPGSRNARAFLALVAPASYKASIEFKDAGNNRNIFAQDLDKWWGWGGLMGASLGIEDMVAETNSIIARTIAEGKGWNRN